METAIAIITGIPAAAVGFVPFLLLRFWIRSKLRSGSLDSLGIALGMVAALISFALMAAEIVTCRLLAANYLLPFSISAIVFFVLAMLFCAATIIRRGW